jgi:hypothetical protein
MTPEERSARIQRALERERLAATAPPTPAEDLTPPLAPLFTTVDQGASGVRLLATVTKGGGRITGLGVHLGRTEISLTNKSTVTGRLSLEFMDCPALRSIPRNAPFYITITIEAPTP